MSRNITTLSAVIVAALTLAPAVIFADEAKNLDNFKSELCYKVASNGDENGTDSTDAYSTSCRDFINSKRLRSPNAIVRAICLNVSQFSADLNETASDDQTAAEAKTLKTSLTRACFSDAQELADKYGIDL